MALNIVTETDNRVQIKNVLMSVSDKTGLEEFVPRPSNRSAPAPKAKNEIWSPSASADRRRQAPVVEQIIIRADVLFIVHKTFPQ